MFYGLTHGWIFFTRFIVNVERKINANGSFVIEFLTYKTEIPRFFLCLSYGLKKPKKNTADTRRRPRDSRTQTKKNTVTPSAQVALFLKV